MPTEQRGKYILSSKPRQKTGSKLWCPYASATWRDAKGWHYHQFNDDKTFDTSSEATVFGFSIARAWIDKNG
jgi:hypothetical protein